MNKRAHKIQHQSLEIEFAELDDAFGIGERIAEIFYSRLQPQMEILFDEMAGDHHLISVERLEIDCGVLPNKAWEDEWVDSTLRRLKNGLLTLPRKLDNETGADAEEAYLFFLQHGHLPWNCSTPLNELRGAVTVTAAFSEKLKVLISENEGVAHRLVREAPGDFRRIVLAEFTKGNEADLQVMQSILFQTKGATGDISDELLLKVFSEQKGMRILPFVQDLYKNSNAIGKKKLESIALTQLNISSDQLLITKKVISNSRKSVDNGIYISNAGLVLLHPFLRQLFEATGLTQQDVWLDSQSPSKAARIMHYLVTARDAFEENEFPLNKILCGLQPSHVANDTGGLSNELVEAGDHLLNEVIGNWTALKNTGTAAFRETFLQRAGKLSPVDNGWLLQVEKRSMDVLLDYLPWGIGIVKLPWMNDIIYVEWA